MKLKKPTEGLFLLNLLLKGRKKTILFAILCCICLLNPLNAFSQTQPTITLQLKGATIDAAFKEIERQSGYSFFYNQNDLNLKTRSDYSIVNKSIESALKIVLKNQPVEFNIKNKHIVLSKSQKSEAENTSPTPSINKTSRVSGVITDVKGEALIGATILVKGTTTGAVTDFDGKFTINASTKNVLLISYVSYVAQEVPITNLSTFYKIQLEEDNKKLDEVVVVGYGSQRKITTIGAQSGIKSITDLKQPVANMTSVLAGRIAGIVGVQRSGEPGKDDAADIWIRGISTFSNSTPLILVDGVERTFGNIDPEDIESFSILKDASATAVYGVKGANGVVLITTKQGKKGKPRIRVEYNKGVTQFTRTPQLSDGITYMQMANEASLTRGGSSIYSADAIHKTLTQEDPYLYPNVNWMKEVFNDVGTNQKANINASGGSDFSQYYVSAGFYNEQGMYKTSNLAKYNSAIGFTRYNFSSNLKMQVTKTTELTLGVKGYLSDNEAPRYASSDIFTDVLKTYPTLYPVSYPTGQIPYALNGGEVIQPLAMLNSYGYKSEITSQTYTDLRLKQNLDFVTKGLTFNVLYAFDAYSRNTSNRINNQPVTVFATGRDTNGNLIYAPTDKGVGKDYLDFSKDTWAHNQFYLETSLNYERIIGTKNRVGGLLLYNQTDYRNTTANTLIESLPYRSLGIAGRATYSYDDKYLSEVNFGYNGAENFAPSRRFGFFPSFGLGWVASNEKIFTSLKDYIQFLKIRFSYGQAGNSKLSSNSADRFGFLSVVGGGNGGFTYGKDRSLGINGVDISQYGTDVFWEVSTKTNLGVDFNLFNNELAIQVDLFKDRRENVFLQRQSVPSYIGLNGVQWGNLGIIDNKGVEFSADWNKKFGNLTVGLRGNFTFNQSKIIEDDSPIKPYPWMESRGLTVNHQMGYIAEGFYTQAEIDDPNVAKPGGVYQAGDLKYKDLNGDKKIDDKDKTNIGLDQVPQIVYGFGLNLMYKNFSFGAFFQGVDRCDILISASNFIPFRDGNSKGNLYSNITDRWTVDNPNQNAIWPRLSYGGDINENYAPSTHWQRNGAYLRLKTLDFGYTVPQKLTKRYGLDNLRVYFLGYNLLTLTQFNWWDVELGSGSGSQYPNTKTYSLGLTFSF